MEAWRHIEMAPDVAAATSDEHLVGCACSVCERAKTIRACDCGARDDKVNMHPWYGDELEGYHCDACFEAQTGSGE